MPADTPRPIVQVDIVSDVVCPWCIVGFRQLDQALTRTGFLANLRWHPFELNPTMPPEGQNLREHIMEKYGSTPEQSQQARDRLTALGTELEFTFNFSDDSRMVNTFQAHQLLDWAEERQLQHPLKMALFDAYFTHGRDVSDPTILADIAGSVGLDQQAAQHVLSSGERQQSVREKQGFWTSRGISGVPSMVFGGKYLVTGAQGVDTYEQLLRRCEAEAA
ncbi:DSBA-like thioredoxin domain protein [Falsiruegeria litorea R37]|uniref:DSBA-like thioredoxin domain protein n=1 Tax=Falsiruegeria litorea R37 TaxID=1200284 RepID=A0A1Y5TC78_9RHOB|nr:DsbA family oxidoreductase [Falsiruegeria litorea]SLN58648.1 DSBA-like thioredoxin domain protein [Falsiruegeria litorea R37]